ncbi:pap oas1 substrate-binding domain-containing protein [Stemphylium lycopersici]|nr:pap oas1 substrate-binding domain-containing protein [Stemphylium lycopersici]
MEQEHAPQPTGLENQLRNMILGNVSISGEQASQDHPPTHRGRGRGRGRGQGQGRGRGRGRGGFHLNADGNGPYHAATDQSQNQGWRPRASASTPFSTGSMRGHHPNQRYQHPQRSLPNPSQNGSLPDNRQQHSTQYKPPTGPAYPQRSRPQGPYAPGPYVNQPYEDPVVQIQHLDNVAAEEVPKVEMSIPELESKEKFRQHLEAIMREAFAKGYSGDIATISLVGFGSLASGFGMPGSDMDLAVVPCWKDPARANDIAIGRGIPRLLERAVLDAKYGGRLLTRTRVPILKICQTPTETLYTALAEERQKWDELPNEEKFPSDQPEESSPPPKLKPSVDHDDAKASGSTAQAEKPTTKPEDTASNGADDKAKKGQHHREKQWTREKVMGPLDFPKTGCGIQCDINFENPLGIHNTQMLRCYSLTDPRVRPMVLFVKSWAKRRKINSAYSGTLSSYGWVLMVLHYLVNVATPPVCPNLQHSVPLPSDATALEEYFKSTKIAGYEVRFWRNEQDIIQAAQAGRLSQNTQSIGALLRGFFQYYASLSGYGYPKPPQFYWTNEVLSLRTPGGILSKQSKGWVSATTKVTAEKKVTNRYLFAIEDPFETDHNVARTVTHRGIVAIRDEFRRAWRILRAVGQGVTPEGGIFDDVVENPPPPPEPKPEATPNEPRKV